MKPPRVCERQIARTELCRLPFSFESNSVKISTFIVIRRYLCISLLGLWDKKKSRRNLPFAFAVNLVKNLVHFFHALSASYSVGREFQNIILRFFSLQMIQVYLLKVYLFSFVNFDRDLARAYGNVRERTTCKTCLTRTSFKGLY